MFHANTYSRKASKHWLMDNAGAIVGIIASILLMCLCEFFYLQADAKNEIEEIEDFSSDYYIYETVENYNNSKISETIEYIEGGSYWVAEDGKSLIPLEEYNPYLAAFDKTLDVFDDYEDVCWYRAEDNNDSYTYFVYIKNAKSYLKKNSETINQISLALQRKWYYMDYRIDCIVDVVDSENYEITLFVSENGKTTFKNY